LILLLLTSNIVLGQSPNKISYQAIIRNNSNALVVSSPVSVRISILQGSASGTAVFIETHAITTNSSGFVNFKIGEGTNILGALSLIDWSNGSYYLKTEVDFLGGTNYVTMGASQLLSVPFALYSENGNVGPMGSVGLVGSVGPVGPSGTPPSGTINGQMLYWNGASTWVPVNPNSSNMVLTSGSNNEPIWTYEGKVNSTLPSVNTVSASAFGSVYARVYGDVTNAGNLTVISKGFCWSQDNATPTIQNVPASQILTLCGLT